MSLWDSLKGQAIDVIEWTETSDDVLAWRFPVSDNEIKNGAQLTVRESQVALVVDQGQPADQFRAGRHVLETENLPILTKLKSWPYGFKSPFKSEVYFFSLRDKLDQRWGTPQPITLRDKEWGSVQVRLFGKLTYRIADPPTFYRRISGTRELYTTDDLAPQLMGHVTGALPAAIAASGAPFLDMAVNQSALAAALKTALEPVFKDLGLELATFIVESISLPEALQQALHERQSMGIVGDVQKYAQYQAAKSIADAAKSGGLAAAGASLAVGALVGQQMAGALGQGQAQSPPATTACIACGKGLEPGSAFCRHCGKPQKRSCPKCGVEAAADAAFCAKCGSQVT